MRTFALLLILLALTVAAAANAQASPAGQPQQPVTATSGERLVLFEIFTAQSS